MKRGLLSTVKNRINDKNFLILSGIILLFLIIKISQIGFKFSDENIYFYMGKIILEGNLPYQDFFFASPPLQILIISMFLLFFGSNIILLKIISLLAVIISSVFIFLLVKRISAPLYGIVASTIYLFSFVILTTTDHSTGIHMTTMFFIISLYLTETQRFFSSGIFSGLALLTRLYSGVAILGIAIYLLIKNRKALLKYLGGIAAIFIPTNALFFSFFGKNYIDSVFLYHLLKSEGISKFRILSFFVRWDFIPLLLSIPAIFLKNKEKIILPFIIGITILLFYIFYADIYYLYFGLLIPIVAILGSWTIYRISKETSRKNIILIVTLLLSFIIIFNTSFYIKDHSPTAKIDFIDDISEYIRENSSPEERIYGNFEITPLVALLSEREIAGNYIDTNEKTFITGLYNTEKRTENLRGNVKFVIMKSVIDNKGNIISSSRIIEENFLLNECTRVMNYEIERDYSSNSVIVFDCKDNL